MKKFNKAIAFIIGMLMTAVVALGATTIHQELVIDDLREEIRQATLERSQVYFESLDDRIVYWGGALYVTGTDGYILTSFTVSMPDGTIIDLEEEQNICERTNSGLYRTEIAEIILDTIHWYPEAEEFGITVDYAY